MARNRYIIGVIPASYLDEANAIMRRNFGGEDYVSMGLIPVDAADDAEPTHYGIKTFADVAEYRAVQMILKKLLAGADVYGHVGEADREALMQAGIVGDLGRGITKDELDAKFSSVLEQMNLRVKPPEAQEE